MATENLKPRAKRLRAAIAELLNVSVTHSQSLELVAKEENYPSWDAACACVGRQVLNNARVTSCSILVDIQRDQTPSIASIFGRDESVPRELSRLLDLSDGSGALVLVAAATWQGKSTTARLVMNEFGLRKEEPSSNLDNLRRLKIIDELRDGDGAFQAVALALAGAKVVATIHAVHGVERLRVLLRQHRFGESLLDRLQEGGQVLSIQQELAWIDPEYRHQSLQIRDQFSAAVRAFKRLAPQNADTAVKN